MANSEESDKLKILKKKRSAIKDKLTHIMSDLLETPNMGLLSLETRMARLEELHNLFLEVQASIELEHEKLDDTKERNSFATNYLQAVNQFSRRIRRLQCADADAGSSAGTSRAVDSQSLKINRSAKVPISGTRSPDLLRSIPTFSGKPTEWYRFHDTFMSLVHNSQVLAAEEKFRILKRALRGEALSVMSSLTVSEENYLIAWNMLQERYNKPRAIVHAHLKLLFKPPNSHRYSPACPQKFAEHIQLHVNALKALGEPTEHWDTVLVHQLLTQLDKPTREAWERTLKVDELPTYKKLISFIKGIN